VVEDNKVNRDILAAFLNRLKLYFVETCNGLEALEEYKRQRYDAILMDIQMPIMDGNTSTIEIRKVEVMRELECQQSNSIPPPRTKIWALTGLASKEDERLVRASGADGILTKPVSLKMLLGLFEQVWPGVSPPKKKK
jgi:CheY-like chemotaxis protein